jgi:hypothetical protein
MDYLHILFKLYEETKKGVKKDEKRVKKYLQTGDPPEGEPTRGAIECQTS